MKHLSCNYIQFEILGLSFCLPLTLVIFTWEVQEKCNMHLYPVWCRSSKSLYCSFYFYFFIYIIHCKFKRENNQVPKIVRVLGNKTNPKIIKMKITTAINEEIYWFKIYWFSLVSKYAVFIEKVVLQMV